MAFPIKEISNLLNLVSRLVTESRYCVALTGAGISTASGIPDFRSPGSGTWTEYSPMEVASLSAFKQNPDRFYTWLRPFIKTIYNAQPNPAHTALADLEKINYLGCVVTQNIDYLHQKAGSKNVVEVHGTYQTLTCLDCHSQVKADQELLIKFLENAESPSCDVCGNILNPDLVLYEELLPMDKWNQAEEEINRCDLLLVLGSSLTVPPVNSLPSKALRAGADVVIINRDNTDLDDQATVTIYGELENLLPIIKEKVVNEKNK